MNQATSQTATSAQDVRRQQQNQPTAAQSTSAASGEDRTAKMQAAMERARRLDGENSADCKGAVSEAQKLAAARPADPSRAGAPYPKARMIRPQSSIACSWPGDDLHGELGVAGVAQVADALLQLGLGRGEAADADHLAGDEGPLLRLARTSGGRGGSVR